LGIGVPLDPNEVYVPSNSKVEDLIAAALGTTGHLLCTIKYLHRLWLDSPLAKPEYATAKIWLRKMLNYFNLQLNIGV